VRGEGGRLDGLVTLSAESGISGPRRWSFLGNGVTGADGLDVLARPEVAGDVRVAVGQALARLSDRWDAIDLEDLPCGSPTVKVLAESIASGGASWQVQRRFACPGFAIAGP